MERDAAAAAALGWPKMKYAAVERERRWLCERIPAGPAANTTSIIDIYLSGTQLRLRETHDLSTGETQLKLARKADLSPSKRIMTTIYLSRQEFTLLRALPGNRIEKTRHTLIGPDGVALALDEFGGGLSGLLMAEAEFASDLAMDAYRAPDFAGREVTGDRRFTGGMLARDGMPSL